MPRSDLERLIRAHQGAIYRYLRYLGAQPALAEDLVQETFLATLKPTLHQPVAPDDPRWAAWLRGIARNRFLADRRRSTIQEMLLDDPILEKAEAAWAESLADETTWDQRLEALRECLKRLGPRQREAIDLRYAKPTGRGEMASRLDLTEDGVKTVLRRIRASLAQCIQERIGAARAGREA